MRTRLLMAVFCILALPMLFSLPTGDNLSNSTPYNAVAVAGHTWPTGYACTCGCSMNCICDPGEVPVECGQGSNAVSNGVELSSDHSGSPAIETPGTNFDFGAGAMLLALAVFAWARFRA